MVYSGSNKLSKQVKTKISNNGSQNKLNDQNKHFDYLTQLRKWDTLDCLF